MCLINVLYNVSIQYRNMHRVCVCMNDLQKGNWKLVSASAGIWFGFQTAIGTANCRFAFGCVWCFPTLLIVTDCHHENPKELYK